MAIRSERIERLRAARLYLVCGAISSERLEAALLGGVGLVQLRMKGAPDPEILATAARLRAICERYRIPLILNDRPDLVVAAGADGVHLGQDDVPVPAARELAGPDSILGLSTHTPSQIDAANAAGVDYIGVGPVNATPTKPGREPVGTALVRHAAQRAKMPFFAIGGVDSASVSEVVAAGAERVAVVRAIADAADPKQAARALRTALDREEAPVVSA